VRAGRVRTRGAGPSAAFPRPALIPASRRARADWKAPAASEDDLKLWQEDWDDDDATDDFAATLRGELQKAGLLPSGPA
jgi:hypothetical protein